MGGGTKIVFRKPDSPLDGKWSDVQGETTDFGVKQSYLCCSLAVDFD